MQLASRFARKSNVLVSAYPIADEAIRRVAPSIFTEQAHESRSSRYVYIPTHEVLTGLRKEGFEPFMVCQSKSRIEGKEEFTKHMVRLRHRSQVSGEGVANEIILLNSHDGTSSYQLLSGMFRFVCQNGMVCGDIMNDIRVKHSGNITDKVIEGAYKVLEDFEIITDQRREMQAIELRPAEQEVFARAALELRYEPDAETGNSTAPIRPDQVIRTRRAADAGNDVWRTFNRAQEALVRGGLPGRNARGQNTTTRAVTGIDTNVKLNRALWQLAQGMAALKTEGVEAFTEALKAAA
jgi:hypothetical protein